MRRTTGDYRGTRPSTTRSYASSFRDTSRRMCIFSDGSADHTSQAGSASSPSPPSSALPPRSAADNSCSARRHGSASAGPRISSQTSAPRVDYLRSPARTLDAKCFYQTKDLGALKETYEGLENGRRRIGVLKMRK